MRAFVVCSAVAFVLVPLPAALARAWPLASAQRSPLPGRYLATTYNPTIDATKPGAKVETVEILDGRGRLVRVVDQGRVGIGAATFSPNGKLVAWIDLHGLNVERMDGTGHRVLVAAHQRCSASACVGLSYAWSPDSRTVAVGGAGRATNELLSVDVQRGVATRIAPVARFTDYQVIGYSPDGTKLALDILGGNPGTTSCCKSLLAVERPDGTARQILFSFSDAIHDGPGDATWSPDGSTLAFTDDGKDVRDPRFGIVDVASATTRSVDGLQTADDPPIWSPDGSQVTAVTYTDGSAITYSVDTVAVSSGRASRIGAGTVPIAWLPGNTILTVGGPNDNTLDALAAAGGTERTIFALPRPLRLSTIEPAPGT